MEKELKIIQTEDGSHSLYRPDLNETYHSFHGAIQESRHVFIQMGLDHWLQKHPSAKRMSVFEVGFGTGLNALLALEWAEKNQVEVYFESLETVPVPSEVYDQLNYCESIGFQDQFQELHNCLWEEEQRIGQYFQIKKVQSTLQEYQPSKKFDVLFFDAFAPSKQPELWELKMMQKSADIVAPEGVFVTYCAKGQLKRDLKTVGFEVETLPGAPGKKEMVRGNQL